MLDTSPSKSSEDNNLSVIGAASGAGSFALLVILFGGVLCIVAMMHHKNKENKKESPSVIYVNTSLTEANKIIEPIYDTPQFLITPSISHTVVFVNPTHESNTGEARATTVMNLDTQDHQASHSSNCNTTSIQTNHYSALLYNGRVTTTTTIATDHSYEAKTTSSPHVSYNADKNGETGNYAPITQPPCDESHTTTCSSQFANTNKPTGEGKYGPIINLPSDVFPMAGESHTTMGSSQSADSDKSTGEGKYGPIIILPIASDVFPVVDESHTTKVSCSTQGHSEKKKLYTGMNTLL